MNVNTDTFLKLNARTFSHLCLCTGVSYCPLEAFNARKCNRNNVCKIRPSCLGLNCRYPWNINMKGKHQRNVNILNFVVTFITHKMTQWNCLCKYLNDIFRNIHHPYVANCGLLISVSPNYPTELLETDLFIRDPSSCLELYESDYSYTREKQLCGSNPNKDTCQVGFHTKLIGKDWTIIHISYRI